MRAIKKVSTTPINKTTGSIIDSFNTTDDKKTNAPSINAVEKYVAEHSTQQNEKKWTLAGEAKGADNNYIVDISNIDFDELLIVMYVLHTSNYYVGGTAVVPKDVIFTNGENIYFDMGSRANVFRVGVNNTSVTVNTVTIENDVNMRNKIVMKVYYK